MLLVKGMGPLWPLGPGAPRVDEGLRSPERAHEGPASLQTPTALWAWPWGLCLWPGLAPSSGGPKAPWQFEGSVGSGVDGFPHPTPGSLRASGARPGRAGCGFPVGRGCCPELATLSGQGLRRRRCQPPDQALPGHRETPPPPLPPGHASHSAAPSHEVQVPSAQTGASCGHRGPEGVQPRARPPECLAPLQLRRPRTGGRCPRPGLGACRAQPVSPVCREAEPLLPAGPELFPTHTRVHVGSRWHQRTHRHGTPRRPGRAACSEPRPPPAAERDPDGRALPGGGPCRSRRVPGALTHTPWSPRRRPGLPMHGHPSAVPAQFRVLGTETRATGGLRRGRQVFSGLGGAAEACVWLLCCPSRQVPETTEHQSHRVGSRTEMVNAPTRGEDSASRWPRCRGQEGGDAGAAGAAVTCRSWRPRWWQRRRRGRQGLRAVTSVCFSLRVTGGELFEDIVAREYYSEADARWVWTPRPPPPSPLRPVPHRPPPGPAARVCSRDRGPGGGAGVGVSVQTATLDALGAGRTAGRLLPPPPQGPAAGVGEHSGLPVPARVGSGPQWVLSLGWPVAGGRRVVSPCRGPSGHAGRLPRSQRGSRRGACASGGPSWNPPQAPCDERPLQGDPGQPSQDTGPLRASGMPSAQG